MISKLAGPNSRNGERGTTMAEFAVVAAVFFMIIFGIVEFGRLLYTYNALTDASRRGARYAVLHRQFAAVGQPNPILCTKNAVVYGETHIDPTTCAATGPALINGLDNTKVVVTYDGADADNNPSTPPTAYGMNLGTATVSIQNYSFTLGIPFASRTFTMGAFTTTLTAESAGEEPTPIAGP